MAKKMNIGVQNLKGRINEKVVEIYPELENLVIEPSLEEQILKSEKYGYNEVTVKGVTAEIDEDIKPENIKEGVEILGVEGGYKGIDTSDGTATADDILENKTAYVNNEKITGTIGKYDGSYEGNADGGIVITDASYLFNNGARMESFEVLLAACKNITSAERMFTSNKLVTELDLRNLNTSQCTNMYYMFGYTRELTKLDVSNFDTSNVTDMSYMFNTTGLKTLDITNFNTSNVTNMSNMFGQCKMDTVDVSNFDTSNVTTMNYMFGNAQFVTLDLSSFDMSKVTNVNNLISPSQYLVNVKSFKNLGKGYKQKSNNYSDYKMVFPTNSPNLTVESMVDIITNGLYDLNLTYDVANGGTLYTQSLSMGTKHLAKLEATEEGQTALALAAAKGWTVS